HCDRSKGHKSLLDCFSSEHGSGCGTCIYEDFYSYEQMHKGKTAAQIRQGIIKGEWKSVDATKYTQPLTVKTGICISQSSSCSFTFARELQSVLFNLSTIPFV